MDDTSRFNQWTRNTTIVITKELSDYDLVKWLGVAALADLHAVADFPMREMISIRMYPAFWAWYTWRKPYEECDSRRFMCREFLTQSPEYLKDMTTLNTRYLFRDELERSACGLLRGAQRTTPKAVIVWINIGRSAAHGSRRGSCQRD